ncbi:MAG: hypothetical protein FWG89_10255 [Treponema sp.]|nr:hypothetical protein [Treponema sp.]
MSFDVGNLITLGITILIVIFFRLLDKSNRSLNKVRKYVDRCKDEITAYLEEKKSHIKDYGIALDVERKAATGLLQRIQALTREELTQKIQKLGEVDERIRQYDSTLEQLVHMTGRVQENLSRIRDESEFVENVGRRVSDIKDKVEQSFSEIDTIGSKLETIEQRFEQENANALENAIESAVSSARSVVLDFEAAAQTIERKIDDHRVTLEKLEQRHQEKLAQDEERIEKFFVEAVERAGGKADKYEEAALEKLREQAQDRLNLIKANFEDKVKTVQEATKAKLGDIQDQFKAHRDEWKSESSAFEAQQKAYSAEWKKDVQNLSVFAQRQKDEWNNEIKELTTLVTQQAGELEIAINKQKDDWKAKTRTTGQEVFAAVQQRINEYQKAQEEQIDQLSGITNDTAKLEAELHRALQEAVNRVNADWNNASDVFNGKLETIKNEMDGVNQELLELKQKAFENVSGKLKGFEDEFLMNLTSRSSEIDNQLVAWKEALDRKLEATAEELELKRQKGESHIIEEVKKAIADEGEKMMADLERLKAETATFEEGIREEMDSVDESRKQFSEQLIQGLEETKKTMENDLKTKIDEYSLSITDTFRQNQKELETQIRDVTTNTKAKIAGIEASSEDIRKNIEEWQTQYAIIRSSMDDIRKEIAAQSKLVDRTEALKSVLDRHVEDMNNNIDRISQVKSEIARFENQFTQIKRLEEDVNSKMTRFITEKHRIEVMESDFARLLQTSRSVEEKLAQVSNSDDVIQSIQVQIRRMEDSIKETEEKYLRIERKNKTLQEINDGIDRNFRALQEDEQTVERLGDTVSKLKMEMEAIESSLTALSADNEKARDAAEKLSVLDDSVSWLEKRIAEMNTARESLGRLATELQTLEKNAKSQLKLIHTALAREEGKTRGKAGGKSSDQGAPPPRDRETIISLKRQGWSIDEIAKTMRIAKGEVELVLELGPKDI